MLAKKLMGLSTSLFLTVQSHLMYINVIIQIHLSGSELINTNDVREVEENNMRKFSASTNVGDFRSSSATKLLVSFQ